MAIEKAKANRKFIAMMEKTIATANLARNRKHMKIMSNVDSEGNVYHTETEIMDAYGYEMITDNERCRLLEALDFKKDHSYIMEDYLISLCHRALRLIDYDDFAESKVQRAKAIKNKIAEIEFAGGKALYCGCCDAVVGELDYRGQRNEYPEYAMCSKGRVCVDCLRDCKKQCKERDD